MFLSYCITHKAISTPILASVAYAAVVAVSATMTVKQAVGAMTTALIAVTAFDLMRFRLRYLNFFRLYISIQLKHYFQKFE